jgi:peroxiredoxin Q/BCP
MPRVGETAPDFELLNQNRQPVRLSDYRGKRVVLFTFARAGTLGCTKQACALRDAMPKIEAGNNVVVLAMSDDSPEALLKWKENQRLPYDLISDPEGVALDLFGASTASILSVKLPVRPHTLWVIDENGIVRGAHAPIMLSDAAKTALKDLKAIDEAQPQTTR